MLLAAWLSLQEYYENQSRRKDPRGRAALQAEDADVRTEPVKT